MSTRASGRARKPSDRALEAATSTSAPRSSTSAKTRAMASSKAPVEVSANDPAKISEKATAPAIKQVLPAMNSPPATRSSMAAKRQKIVKSEPTTKTSTQKAEEAPTKAPKKKVAKKSAATLDREGNKCADDNDRNSILGARVLSGKFPFIEERVIGERRLDRSKGRPKHDYLISAMPQWISADRLDQEMARSWNNEHRLIVDLAHYPYSDVRVMRGHPMLDERSYMGTEEWNEAESRRLMREFVESQNNKDSTHAAYTMLGRILCECIGQEELSRGVSEYVYADKESKVLADEVGTRNAAHLVNEVLRWNFDDTLEANLQRDPRYKEIRIAVADGQGEMTNVTYAVIVFSGVFKSLLKDIFFLGLSDDPAVNGRHFFRSTSVDLRRAIAHRLITLGPHFRFTEAPLWTPLLILLLLPLEEIGKIGGDQGGESTADWHTRCINRGLTEYYNLWRHEGSYIEHVMPTFLFLAEMIQKEPGTKRVTEDTGSNEDDSDTDGPLSRYASRSPRQQGSQSGDSGSKDNSYKASASHAHADGNSCNSKQPTPRGSIASKASSCDTEELKRVLMGEGVSPFPTAKNSTNEGFGIQSTIPEPSIGSEASEEDRVFHTPPSDLPEANKRKRTESHSPGSNFKKAKA